jgi:Uma2 family endonuclease
MLAQATKTITSEEYLARERTAAYKSEYFAGEVFAMAGASRRHNLIAANLIRTLGNQLLTSDCNVYPSDMRVKIEPLGTYTYPDVVVACGQERFEDAQNDTLLNPMLIIEILSDSTEAYDRGKKFEHYQMVDSLAEYLLISQIHCRVEQYVRQNSQVWTYREFHDINDVIPLHSIKCQLALKETYAKLQMFSVVTP